MRFWKRNKKKYNKKIFRRKNKMADYCCTIRTNYFHVKNEEKFRELMSRTHGYEDKIKLLEKQDENGNAVFGFGLYGVIAGVANAKKEENGDEYLDENAYAEFIHGLQTCVADDDAIIIMEAGNEKLKYVVGSAFVITNKDTHYLDIDSVAIQKAAEMLGNPAYKTQLNY
jgi:hypothetical protein